ncbi:MAG: MFS transporter [bacterium]|nr:MFS transporter [bacterium]
MTRPRSPYATNIPRLCVIRLLFWMHFITAIMVPFFRDWGGIDLGRILFLNAWFMAWNFLLEVPTGTIADRFSRKASIVSGLAMGAAAMAIYVSAPRFEVFLLAEIVAALSYTLLSGADEALVYDSLEADGRTDEASRVFARIESFKLAGIVLGALGGAALATPVGLRTTVALQVIPMGAAALVAFSLREPAHHKQMTERASYRTILREGMRHFASTPALRALAFDMVTVHAASWLIIWLYQPLLEAAGIGIAFFGAVHVALSGAQIVVLSQAARLERWLGSSRRLLRVSAWVPGLAFMGLGAAGSPWAVVPLIVLVAGFGLARATLFAAALNLHIPSERRATVLSTISMLRTLAIVIGNSLGGLAVAFSLHGTALAAGVAILLFSTLTRTQQEHLPD